MTHNYFNKRKHLTHYICSVKAENRMSWVSGCVVCSLLNKALLKFSPWHKSVIVAKSNSSTREVCMHLTFPHCSTKAFLNVPCCTCIKAVLCQIKFRHKGYLFILSLSSCMLHAITNVVVARISSYFHYFILSNNNYS